jgi:hypothetical protein
MGDIPGLSVTVGWTEDVAGVTEGIAWEMFNSTDKDMEVNKRCRPNPLAGPGDRRTSCF